MPRRLAVVLLPIAMAAITWLMVGSCRNTPRTVAPVGTPDSSLDRGARPDASFNPPGTASKTAPEPSKTNGNVEPLDAGPPDEPGSVPTSGTAEFRRLMAKYGIAEPLTNEGLEVLMRHLMDEDDATLRRTLLAYARAGDLKHADDLKPGRLHPKWNLPNSFGERLLRLAESGIGRDVDQTDDDGVFFLMLVQALERMRYEPAATELAQPGALRMYGLLWRHIFVEFGKAAIPSMAEAAQSSKNHRMEALNVLRYAKDPDGIPDLQTLLQHADPEVRVAATEGLMALGAPVDTAPWREMLEEGKGTIMERSAAIKVLGAGRRREDIDYLLSFVQKRIEDPKLRAANRSMDEARSAVTALVSSEDSAAVTWALEMLGKKGPGRDIDTYVRFPIIIELGKRKVEAAMPNLLAILNDETESCIMRCQAAGSLSDLDPENRREYARRANQLRQEESERLKASRKEK